MVLMIFSPVATIHYLHSQGFSSLLFVLLRLLSKFCSILSKITVSDYFLGSFYYSVISTSTKYFYLGSGYWKGKTQALEKYQ